MNNIFKWLEKRKILINDKNLILNAFTHSSYVNEHGKALKDNERLEFMGDAVLQLWTTKKLFLLFDDYAEGELTLLRAKLVREESLAKYARELELGRFLRLGHGEEKTGGRERDSILADMFEAFLGALFLDVGIGAVEIVLEEAMGHILETRNFDFLIDYKTKLQELVQTDTRKTVVYETVSITGPSNAPEFEVVVKLDNIVFGNAKGSSKKKAEQAAAKIALEKLVK